MASFTNIIGCLYKITWVSYKNSKKNTFTFVIFIANLSIYTSYVSIGYKVYQYTEGYFV